MFVVDAGVDVIEMGVGDMDGCNMDVCAGVAVAASIGGGGSDMEPTGKRELALAGDVFIDATTAGGAVAVASTGTSTTRTSYTCKIRLREPRTNSMRPSSSTSAIHAAEMLHGTRRESVGVRRRVCMDVADVICCEAGGTAAASVAGVVGVVGVAACFSSCGVSGSMDGDLLVGAGVLGSIMIVPEFMFYEINVHINSTLR